MKKPGVFVKYSRFRVIRQRQFIAGASLLLLLLTAVFLFVDIPRKENENQTTQVTDDPLMLAEEAIFERVRDLMYTNPDSARSLVYQRLDKMSPEMMNHYEMVYQNILGSAYFFQSNYTLALNGFYKTLELALERNSKTHAGNAYNNIGVVNILLGNYKDALDFLRNALDIYESLNRQRDIASSKNNIGRIYYEINDMDMALRYYREAYEGFVQEDDLIGISSVANHLAQYYTRKQRSDSALYYFNQSVALSLQSENNFGLATSYLELGHFYLAENRHLMAMDAYLKSDSIARHIESKSSIIASLLGKTRTYLAMDQADEALLMLDEALYLARSSEDEKQAHEAVSLLAQVYEMKADVVSALKYFKQAEEMKLLLEGQSEHAQVYNLEIQRLVNTMARNEREAEREKLLSQRRKTLLTALIVLLILSLIILSMSYYIYLNKIKQKQKDQESENRLRHSAEKTQAVMNAEIGERKRLSAELHDGIGPMLSLAKINIANILEKAEMDEGKKRSLLETSRKNIEEVLREMKHISNNMSPKILTDKGFAEALKDLSLRLAQLRRFEVGLSMNGFCGPYKPHIEHALYRTVQEVLNNAVKHAECSELNIHLLHDAEELTLMIEDNGRGFNTQATDKPEGMGLKNAASRIEGLGGQFLIDSMPGRGTIVTMIVPAAGLN